jgi:hypothetical protein
MTLAQFKETYLWRGSSISLLSRDELIEALWNSHIAIERAIESNKFVVETLRARRGAPGSNGKPLSGSGGNGHAVPRFIGSLFLEGNPFNIPAASESQTSVKPRPK